MLRYSPVVVLLCYGHGVTHNSSFILACGQKRYVSREYSCSKFQTEVDHLDRYPSWCLWEYFREIIYHIHYSFDHIRIKAWLYLALCAPNKFRSAVNHRSRTKFSIRSVFLIVREFIHYFITGLARRFRYIVLYVVFCSWLLRDNDLGTLSR